ncbi:hypothetical protein SVEN_5585 [Streptomyces venezuelae ATCC 10712]|uniref:Uncharacterized protein n=1 Tax=Streptomyces venezuelae (strain ATCC 10712 / CBS 650.69 / DSM 40230 / JCM 4526 / NBRC 13096 / PD 04745) TaxID=953739 RepID=F2R862_STRVP|nr:hypothetical protein SVEN_5585 [Streptomyces venezuelae ATCC 10712]
MGLSGGAAVLRAAAQRWKRLQNAPPPAPLPGRDGQPPLSRLYLGLRFHARSTSGKSLARRHQGATPCLRIPVNTLWCASRPPVAPTVHVTHIDLESYLCLASR